MIPSSSLWASRSATGFTGRLTAEAMTRAGLAPVLAGRSPDSLVELVAELAPHAPIDAAPTWRQADVSDPASVRALVDDPSDVLVSTVGPFARLGRVALDAAIVRIGRWRGWTCDRADETRSRG
mgnify:CR=1 FL=1